MNIKKRYILLGTGVVALLGLYGLDNNIQTTCVPGNPAYEAGTGICSSKNAANAKKEAEAAAAKAEADAKAAADVAAARAKSDAALAESDRKKAEYAKAAAAERAKFEAEGWWEADNGVFLRWCTDKNPCPGPAGNGYSDYSWKAMVYCRDRACGDIYARLNIERDGVVIGWTNDTAYGDYRQKVVLTFGSDKRGNGNIVQFKARG